MSAYIIWLAIGLLLLILELFTGTFYLLMFSIAFAGGGIAAAFRLNFSLQLLIAAIIGTIGIIMLRKWHKTRQKDQQTSPFNLDAGNTVKVGSWREDGTTRVHYRGTEWDARSIDNSHLDHHVYEIVTIENSVLIIKPHN